MHSRKRRLYWRLCCSLATILMILAFTPVFLPTATLGPSLFGLPYTLWAGILLCLVMVILTYLATLVHPGREGEWKDNHPQVD
ncbi:hypothetical protein GGR26_000848 [Lewinella marina]|uniref:DUF3311 domain-containing protein n=1 Tax=Neolewinella marina TaxID=438751 RepID=A0A2G0CIG6_9BACT|nr:hypothetical protein [Neolewinella marina]NJB85103.1 hypothetical protein [Neolewinella marina]PHK99759.1 hypothetical protein CGL56_01535 [Neolewinella marina]